MYKVGDRVKTIQKIQPHTKEYPIAVEGEVCYVSTDKVQVELDVQTEYGHRCGYGLLRYFKLADLLAYDVLRPKSKETQPGWTFRATKDTFDGARVLRELDAAGADYAVVVWGKDDIDRCAVVHTRFYTRLVMAGLAVGVSNPVWSVGPNTPRTIPAASVTMKYHTVTQNGKPATLAQLMALMANLTKIEQKRATFTTYVAYGKADG